MSQSLRRVPRAAAVVRLAATVLTLVFAATCVRDQTTAPPLRSPPSAAVHGTYTTLGTYSIPIPPNNTLGGAQPVANTGILVPAGTYYRVRVNGTVTVSANPEYVQAYGTPWDKMGTFGPFGTIDGELIVQLKARNTDGSGTNPISFLNPQYNSGASGPDSARSDIVYTSKAIEVQAGRTGIGGVQNDNCCHWSIGMFALTASQTVTVEQVTDVAHVVANPVAVHPNTQVTFTASRDDGGNLIVYNWHWQPDAGQPGNATNLCGGGNPCQMNVAGSGTMLVYTNAGNPTAHVVVSNNFTVTADQATVHPGDSVTFTSKYDGTPGPAARWSWIPDDTSSDHGGCPSGSSGCRRLIHGPGTMWAFSATSGGDSAKVHIATLPRRKLTLSPTDTIWVPIGSTQEFIANGEGGAAVVDSHWSGTDFTISADRISNRPSLAVRPSPGGQRRQSFGNASSTTCADGVTDCTDVVNGSYVRTVTAVVDDSTQTQSVTVAARALPPPDSTDTASDSSEVSETDGTAPWCIIPNFLGDKKRKAYCKGSPPTGTDLVRIKDAIDSIRSKPAPCPYLAQIGDSLLAHGTLHVFPYDTSYGFSGAVGKIGGGWSGPNSWMVVGDAYTKVWYDRTHHAFWPAAPTDRVGNVNVWLQVVLAHEFDHLSGGEHMVTDSVHMSRDIRLTPNTYVCGGLP